MKKLRGAAIPPSSLNNSECASEERGGESARARVRAEKWALPIVYLTHAHIYIVRCAVQCVF